MNLIIPCTACSDWQPSMMRLFHQPAALAAAGQGEGWCLQGMALSLVGGLLLLFSALDMDHCSSQLKSGEHPGPSTHKHTTDPHSPPAHTDSDTNMHPLANKYTYKNIHMHTNMYKLTQANTKLNTHIIIALSFVHYYDTWTHTDIVQFYFLPAYKFGVGGWEKMRNWIIQPKVETDPTWLGLLQTNSCIFIIQSFSLFSPLHLCVCSLSLPPPSLHTFFLSSTTALHKHEKGSCSAISAERPRIQSKNNFWSKNKTNYYQDLELMKEGSNRKAYKFTKLSLFTTTRAVLRELYTQVPSPSRTHTKHTKHILSKCCVFCSDFQTK